MGDRFRGQRGPRRKTAWQQGPEAVGFSLTATGSALWGATGASMASGREVTLVRTRGQAHIVMDAWDSVGAGFRGALGIAMATPEAIAVGITAVKTPLADVDWDGWLWHSMFDVRAITAAESEATNATSVHQRIEIDSKAMRKISDEMVLFGAVEVVEAGISSVDIWANTRCLVKLA